MSSDNMLPPLAQIPADLVSLGDYAKRATAHMPRAVYEYIVGGGADEISQRRNREMLDRLLISPRVLVDVTRGSTETRVLGEGFRHPIMLAPVAFHKLVHPEGEIATARAASVLETPMVVSTLSSVELESIARTLDSPRWFQLYFQQDREFTLSLVRRAEDAGYTCLMITVDAPLHGIRNRAQRAGFELPEGVEAVNLKQRPPLPRRVLEPSQSIVFQGMMTEAPNWEGIRWLQSHSRLPIILKGVLSTADALKAQQMGIAGLVISNHGGRALDCVPSAIEVLPAIRQAVGAEMSLLLDGAIERGTDVFKALALGADAVMVGRPQLYALAVAGAPGVAHMLRILREELEVCMALAGTPTLADIGRAALYQPAPSLFNL
ncbi:alpha-hydroxy-acid oxidizing enzyme [Marinobacterium zhoushanense]|uniref:Alpha-hydroxy-acid oxidizing enzyme n=1 Tax=Marinobacterium zhoushanense TaxID=1679163 RepID=A0ABQ1KHQ5_9GAMM|nr:alpha-hydroxy acid oxidase [Marinobacterium zhoushanense]GGB96682.1 alpha-hydroxy-acid oxidizing enzyme [Marinobacterium zhoushanense]